MVSKRRENLIERRERAMKEKETASQKRKGRDRGRKRIFSLHLRLSKTAAEKIVQNSVNMKKKKSFFKRKEKCFRCLFMIKDAGN